MKLVEASVEELGDLFRNSENQIKVDCPDSTETTCSYKVNEDTVADYSLRQLLKYPYCESHGCSLELTAEEASKGDSDAED